MGKEIGLQIDRQNVLVKYAVTDGDGRGAEGINDALKVLHPLWKVERQADPIHLGRSQFRQSNSANFSLNMFYGSTREKKKQGQKVLSQDLKARCSLVFNEMWKENCGNLEKIKKCLPRVLDATVRNFEGRASAIIHTLNNGIANSWKQKAECIGFKISQGSFKHLEQMQRECERNKVYQNTPERKKKNLQQTGQKIKDHVEEKEQSKFKDRYQKGQLDPKLNTAFVQSTKDDHSYGRVLKEEAKSESHDETHVTDESYRVVKMNKVTLLLNVVVKFHNLQDIKCDNPNFELTKLIKYGSCVKCIYKCTECKFTSPCVNLFDEIKTPKRGPNPGELTRMLVSALQETPIGIKEEDF
ncbi:unnamed protein product [Mytilus edulis]|uniref:Mutator-like transposase domain-containing protein n=1 Tax=Mytilus edulis TaxID=6550 RepID=A0A8S3SB52_MYTED|nr:unnamed protein product [Mytilus edulis]